MEDEKGRKKRERTKYVGVCARTQDAFAHAHTNTQQLLV